MIDAVGTAALPVDVRITNSTMVDSRCPDGVGGAVAIASGLLSVVRTTIERSHALQGAAIHLSSVSTTAGVASTTASVNASVIREGNATGLSTDALSGGGGLFADGSTSLVVDGSTLELNSADGNGGAMRIEGASSAVLRNSVLLRDNTAVYGGGLSAHGASQIEVYDSELSYNTAEHGGALHSDGSTLTATNIDVLNNSAIDHERPSRSGGGGISAVEGSTLYVTDIRAFGNVCPLGPGGGMRVERSKITLISSYFRDNQAGNGGGVSIAERNQDGEEPIITNVVFESNRVDEPEPDLASSEIKGEGGGLHLGTAGTVNVRNSTFTHECCKVGRRSRGDRQHECLPQYRKHRWQHCRIEWRRCGRRLGSLVSDNDVHTNNAAGGAGGAAYFLSSLSPIVMRNGTAIGNEALSSGGALEVSGSSLDLRDSYFRSNGRAACLTQSCALSGGGLMLRSRSQGKIRGTTFEGNTAANGAAVALQDATMEATLCEIINNTAKDKGGGVDARSSQSLQLRNLTFDGNVAPDGGGLHLKEVPATRCTPALRRRRGRAARLSRA